MKEYRKPLHGNTDYPAANTPAPERQTRGWEDLANEYSITDMMDLADDAGQPEATIEAEYNAYTTVPLSPRSTNIIKFWEVSTHKL